MSTMVVILGWHTLDIGSVDAADGPWSAPMCRDMLT